jgi:hypothetical protein
MYEGGGDQLDLENFKRNSSARPRHSNSSVTRRNKKLNYNYSFSSQESCVNPEPLFDVSVGKNRSNFMKIKRI